jgi:hypothetical protein
MSIITPYEYTTNIMMHQKHDIENNYYELLKKKLHVHDQRIIKLENKIENKIGCMSGIFTCVTCLENVCLWTLVILLSIKVFS